MTCLDLAELGSRWQVAVGDRYSWARRNPQWAQALALLRQPSEAIYFPLTPDVS